MDKIIILIGAPGAGKGTQARLLEERKKIPQISTGDMFREMKNLDSPLAREVQAIMNSGKLISDELTFQIVKERTSREDCKGTYILDGFPRTATQAEMLEVLALEQGKEISAIMVDVPLCRNWQFAVLRAYCARCRVRCNRAQFRNRICRRVPAPPS